MDELRITELTKGPPIYVVTGGTGASGELLVRTVLAQFRHVNVPLIIKSHIQTLEQVEQVVNEISDAEGTIVHSMVNEKCRRHLVDQAARKGIYSVDLVAPLLDHLEAELGQEPLGQPGLYRQLHSAYFDRVNAIEYAVAHDDGKRVQDLHEAEIVLIGVSRAGKTPISMYLSILGWKVANVPFVFGLTLPDEISQVERSRLVGTDDRTFATAGPSTLATAAHGHPRWELRSQRTAGRGTARGQPLLPPGGHSGCEHNRETHRNLCRRGHCAGYGPRL